MRNKLAALVVGGMFVVASMVLAACGPTVVPKTTVAATVVTETVTPGVPTSTPTTALTATPSPTPLPTPTPTATPIEGELWYDQDHHIPYTVGSADGMNEHQVQAARELLKLMLDSPYVQRLIQQMPDKPVCAYQKVFDARGDLTTIGQDEIPGGTLYVYTSKMMEDGTPVAVSYYNSVQLQITGDPTADGHTGWSVVTRPTAYGSGEAVGVYFSFYDQTHKQRVVIPWDEMCSGLPLTVFSPETGNLTKDALLSGSSLVDKMDDGSVVALLETLYYEEERAQTGNGHPREFHYDFLPNPLLWGNVPSGEVDISPMKDTKTPDPSDPDGLVIAGVQPHLSSPEKLHYTNQFGRMLSITKTKAGYLDPNTVDNVARHWLTVEDNIPPYAPVILPKDYTDGEMALAVTPAYATTLRFWERMGRKYIVPGYNGGDVHVTAYQWMFPNGEPNFRADLGQDTPTTLPVDGGDPIDLLGRPTLGVSSADPLLLAVNFLPQFSQALGAPNYPNWDLKTRQGRELSAGALLPFLFFHTDGAVVYGEWHEVTSTPEVYAPFHGVDEGATDDNGKPREYINDLPLIDAAPDEYEMYGQGIDNLTNLGLWDALGRAENDIISNPAAAAGGGYYLYGGPVSLSLPFDFVRDGKHVENPFMTFDGGTFANPKTGLYHLRSTALRKLSEDHLFGLNLLCGHMGSDASFDQDDHFTDVAQAWCAEVYDPNADDLHYSNDKIWQRAPMLADKFHIVEGLGALELDGALRLATQRGRAVDNPEALKSIKFPAWTQSIIAETQKNGNYDESAPALGVYALPTAFRWVMPISVSPLCQADVSCLILSSVWGIGDAKEQTPQEHYNPYGMPVMNTRYFFMMTGIPLPNVTPYTQNTWGVPSQNAAEDLFYDIQRTATIGWMLWGFSEGEDENAPHPNRLKDNHWLVDNGYFYVPDYAKVAKDEKNGEHVTAPKDSLGPWNALTDYDDWDAHLFAVTAGGAQPFFVYTFDFARDKSLRPFYQTAYYANHYGELWTLDAHKVLLNGVNNLPYTYGYNHMLLSPVDATLYVNDDPREVYAALRADGRAFPMPHVEDAEYNIHVIYEDGTDAWYVVLNPDKVDLAALKDELSTDDRKVAKLIQNPALPHKSLCEATPFYWEQKKFGHTITWERAWKFWYGEDATPPAFSCDRNTFASLPMVPEHYPFLMNYLDDGHLGGLPEGMTLGAVWKAVDKLDDQALVRDDYENGVYGPLSIIYAEIPPDKRDEWLKTPHPPAYQDYGGVLPPYVTQEQATPTPTPTPADSGG